MPQQTYTTTGRIHALPDAEQRGNFTIRKLVLEIDGYKRSEFPVFEFFGKHADKLSGLRVGDDASVTRELKGNEHKDRFFVTLSAFKIESNGQRQSSPDRNFDRPKGRTVQGLDDSDSIDF
jgi:hypothetical protein